MGEKDATRWADDLISVSLSMTRIFSSTLFTSLSADNFLLPLSDLANFSQIHIAEQLDQVLAGR